MVGEKVIDLKKKNLFVDMSCNYLVGDIVQKISFIFLWVLSFFDNGSWVICLLRMCKNVYIKIAKINIENFFQMYFLYHNFYKTNIKY